MIADTSESSSLRDNDASANEQVGGVGSPRMLFAYVFVGLLTMVASIILYISSGQKAQFSLQFMNTAAELKTPVRREIFLFGLKKMHKYVVIQSLSNTNR